MKHDPQALRRVLTRPERAAHNTVVIEAVNVTASGDVLQQRARVQPVLERYRRRGLISLRQEEAGRRLYHGWAFGLCGARLDGTGGTVFEPHSISDARLAAMTDFRKAIEALPTRLVALTLAVCCEDMPVSDAAKITRRNVTALMELLKLALSTLADHYRLPGAD